jgi:hypothetical protein
MTPARPGTISNIRGWWIFGTAAAGAGPLALWTVDLYPPWPSASRSVVVITTISCAVGAIAAWNFRFTNKQRRRMSTLALLAGTAFALAYLATYSLFVCAKEQLVGGQPVQRRWIIGYSLRDDYAGSQAPCGDLLALGEFQPENIWTATSLTFARLSVLTSFCSAFVFLTIGVTMLGGVRPPR